MRFDGVSAYKGNDPYIFLSYSHKDAKQAKQITLALMNAGYRIWYDEGLTPAREWDENVARSIENCCYMIALISKNYLDSDNCRDELNYARDQNKPRLLIYLEDVTLPSGMRMRIGRLQALFFWEYRSDAELIEKISGAEGIARCLSNGKPSSPLPVPAPSTTHLTSRKRLFAPLGLLGVAAVAFLITCLFGSSLNQTFIPGESNVLTEDE